MYSHRQQYIKILLMDTNRSTVRTRLIGRPQTQMYPPVALNQYFTKLFKNTHIMHILPQKEVGHSMFYYTEGVNLFQMN